MHKYEPLLGAFFNREFPTSWRQIDLGVVVNDDTANKNEEEAFDGETDTGEVGEEENEDEGEEEEAAAK
jgi:hypothetical protein